MTNNEALEMLEEIKPKLKKLKEFTSSKGKSNETRRKINRTIHNLGHEKVTEEIKITDYAKEVSSVTSNENNLNFILPNRQIKLINVDKFKRKFNRSF